MRNTPVKKIFSLFLSFLFAMTLAACNGGGGSDAGGAFGSGGGAGGGGGGDSKVTGDGINIVATSAILDSNAASVDDGIEITAVVTDKNNNLLSGATVTFTATSGAIQVPVDAVTDANGELTAVLTTGGDPTARTITVTAKTGNKTRTIDIQVVVATGTGGGGAPVAALALNASSAQMPADAATPSSSGAVTLTAFVRDSNNIAIEGAPVTFSATSGQLANVQAVSDANGQATAVLTTGGDPTLRTITVTASSGTVAPVNVMVQVVAGSTGVAVSQINLSSDSPSLASDASDPADGVKLTAVVLDANLNPISDVTVSFSTTAGALADISAVTDSNGRATAVLTTGGSSSLPSPINVTATVGTISDSVSIVVVNPVASITLLSSSPELPSGASTPADGIALTAIAKDSNGNLSAGVNVTFSAPGAGLQVTQGTTDASGVAKAILTTGGNQMNRNVAVTASTSGTTSNTLTIAVVGTTLIINGPGAVNVTDTASYQVVLLDSKSNGVASQSITLTSALGNAITSSPVTTNSSGKASFDYTGTNSGSDIITATATGVSSTLAVNVANATLAFLPQCDDGQDNDGNADTDFGLDPDCQDAFDNNEHKPGIDPVFDFSDSTLLTVRFMSGGVPTPGRTINVVTTRGVLGGVTDNGDGTYTFSIVSNGSDGAGGAVVTATESLTGSNATANIVFRATTPASLALQATPATIAPQSTSTLTATVRDASNNLVANQTVNFVIVQDPTGGQLSAPSAQTNSQGVATVTYQATTTTSANNGVEISAEAAGFPAATDTTFLTVNGQALFISLGTGNDISEDGPTRYKLPYAALVVDSAGNPAPPNTVFSLEVISVAYQKGTFSTCIPPWVPTYSVGGPTTVFGAGCPSEDLNNNGILDSGEDSVLLGTGNGNGKLEPGNVVTVPNTVPLDTDGSADFDLTYTKDRAYWVRVTLRAKATVAGTESVAEATFVLPGLASDYNNCAVAPPGQTSPYGTAALCTVPD